MDPLPIHATLEEYERQAAGDRPALARAYGFPHWEALATYVAELTARTPGIYEFESAVEAVVTGNEPALRQLLATYPPLPTARSTRITTNQPPVHQATLLHYCAANGVENCRQLSPPNAVQIARLLLDAGAVPDALAPMYEGEWPTLALLVSSTPPALAGVQVPLLHLLLDYGADPNGPATPLFTALAFGFLPTAQALAQRGARVDRLPLAAGLARHDEAAALLPAANPLERQQALALAAQLGHLELVRLLLDAGEDPNRFNPKGLHAHSTPLHQAALLGHEAVVRLLVQRGARRDLPDKIWNATPDGWAEHGGHSALAASLRD